MRARRAYKAGLENETLKSVLMFNKRLFGRKTDAKKDAASVRSVLRQAPVGVTRTPNGSPYSKRPFPMKGNSLTSDLVFTTQEVIDSVQAPQDNKWVKVPTTMNTSSIPLNCSNRIYLILKPDAKVMTSNVKIGSFLAQLGPMLKQYVDPTDAEATDTSLELTHEGFESYTINMLSKASIETFLETVDASNFLEQYFDYNANQFTLNSDVVYIPTADDIANFSFIGDGILASRCVSLDDSPVIQTTNVGVQFTVGNGSGGNATYTPGSADGSKFTNAKITATQIDPTSGKFSVDKMTAVQSTALTTLKGYVFGIAEVILPATSVGKHKIASQLVAQDKVFQQEYIVDVITSSDTTVAA